MNITISKSDYKTGLFLYSVYLFLRPLRLGLLILTSFFIGIIVPVPEEYLLLVVLVLSPLGFLLSNFMYILILDFLIPVSKTKKLFGTSKFRKGFSFEIQEDYITIKTTEKERNIYWRELLGIKVFKNNILISLMDNSVIILPKNNFENDSIIDEIVKLVQDGIIKIKGTLKIPIFSKPPYYLVLLCIIPLMGIIFGILILLLGIIKYKDRICIIIGILGISLNVVINIIAYSDAFDKDKLNEIYLPASQNFLNDLIRDIEFYKMQNGVYPKNLDELKKKNVSVMTIDPLRGYNEENKEFNYQLVGDKYRLFSSGIDGIPGTEDDIYPNIENQSKFGFIK